MEKVICLKSKFLYGLMNQNTYVLTNGKEAVIIDAGAEIDDVKNAVGKAKVVAILMTHLHFDHFWNLESYLKEFDASVYISKGAENKFVDSRLNAAYLVNIQKRVEIAQNRIKYYANKLTLGGFNAEIFKTPGHSEDSVSVFIDDKLFTGDTIFSDCVGRTDLPDSNNEELLESLKTIKKINYLTAFPGHNESASKNQIDETIGFYL